MNKVMEPKKNNLSLEQITGIGTEFYFAKLYDKLTKTNIGEYVVIEPETKEYFIDQDLMKAITKAKAKFPDKLFCTIHIGSLHQPVNYAKIRHAHSF